MRILLTGANGQVGHALRASLAPLGEVVCATRDGRLDDGTNCEAADFERPDDVANLIHQLRPDVVTNAAAYTAVDRAENEPDAAFRVNAEAVDAMARACARRGALFVHYSTDYVFPGADPRPLQEVDPTGPLNVYGASKLAGEEAIRASGSQHLIFRISWVYSTRGRNFMRTMLQLAGERSEVRVVDDQVGAPTPSHWIAHATAKAVKVVAGSAVERPIAPWRSGTWHMASRGQTSWHGFAEAIFDQAVRAGIICVRPAAIPISTTEHAAPALRPKYSLLDTDKLGRDFGIFLPCWRRGLSEALAACKEPACSRGSD